MKCENDENKDAEIVDCSDTTGVTFVAINKSNHQINANYEILDETEQIEKNDGLWKCKVCVLFLKWVKIDYCWHR